MAQGNNASNTTTDQSLYDKKNFDNMNCLDDIFDVLDYDDDNNDEVEHVIEEYNEDFDFDYVYTNVDEEVMIIQDDSLTDEDHDSNIFGEQILSQKLSQLSTKDNNEQEEHSVRHKKRQLSTTSTPDVASKKLRVLNENENEQETIPAYLQTTNRSFDKTMSDHLMNSTTTIRLEDLRQLAILKHKIVVNNMDKELWTVYYKSGTGQWQTSKSKKTNVVDRRLWPEYVKTIMLSKLGTTNTDEAYKQTLCEEIVSKRLREIKETIAQYQIEFDGKKNCLLDFTNKMENKIETFIGQYGIQSLQMKHNYEIAILQYDYDTELLEREYLRFKPTKSQIEVAKRLYKLRYEHLQAKQELIELKQRILCNKPTALMTSVSLLVSSSTTHSLVDKRFHQRRIDQHDKELQEKMTDFTATSIAEGETKIHECRKLFNQEILGVSATDGDENERLTGNLIDIIYRRFEIIKKKVEYIGNFRVNYYLRSRYDDFQDEINGTITGFSPTMIIDTPFHQLTVEQLKLLNRGPTYVPPCQMHLEASSSLPINDIVKKQYVILRHSLNILLTKNNMNAARKMFIDKEIKDAFINIFSISLLSSIQQRALYEKRLVQSIRQHLKANSLILRRTVDQKNVFYLGDKNEFEEKANAYMMITDAFEISEIIDETNLQKIDDNLNKAINTMNSELKTIFNNNKQHKDLLEQLFVNMTKVELPYLYFLPSVTDKNDISVEPVIVSQRSITSRLGQFLDRLLRPVIKRYIQSTTFANGADFIQKLNQYSKEERRLRRTTIFTTIEISNFYTMVSHESMLITLGGFLTDYLATPFVGNISITRIVKLTSLFLNNNRFYYDNKIYSFKKGAPSSLLFAETLSNIYVFQWQKLLLNEPLIGRELFGRCKNQIFFTCNATTNELRDLLQIIRTKHTNIHLEITTGLKIHFLNAHIENQNGTLYSRVYHDPTIQKYTLPYVIGHSKIAHSHWFRSALIRAARYCTSVNDFNQERIYLELTCLGNGYSLEFIEKRIDHFFTHFDAPSLRLFLDQHVYDQLRIRLFNFMNEQQRFFDKNHELEKDGQLVRLSYQYEFGPKREFNKKLYKIVSDNLKQYAQPPKSDIKMKLTTIHQHSLNALLSRQKPYHILLNKKKTMF